MGRAQLRVEVNETFTIDGVTYRVAEHPALPGIPYVQRGARGFVVQLIAPGGERMALKYFKLKYRVPELVKVADALRQYAELPGLRAARRTVFTAQTHPALIRQYPALEYGMLMPWLPGVTWYDIITTRAPLTPRDGLRLAQRTSEILATLEANGLAHCDIAGANVMVERRATHVELVDIEEMFGPGQPPPVEAPAGQDGYQHRASRASGQWRPEGDRFGAAVLLAEMLGWPDGRIRVNSADEHYFAAAEMQDATSTRFRLLAETLEDSYAPAVAQLFEAAWRSATLDECPSLAAWRDALAAITEVKAAEKTAPAASPGSAIAAVPAAGSGVISGRRAIGVPVPAEQPDGELSAAERLPDQIVHERLHLEGIKLCRNCGAQNNARESFCTRCGFYIGTGARKPVAVMLPMDRAPGAQGQAPAKVTAPPPQAVPLNRNLNEVVTAKRVGDKSGGGMRRVEMPKPSEDTVEANAGSMIVAAILIALVLTVLALVLIAR